MAKRRRKKTVEPKQKHSVDLSFKAWDIAKAGAALKFKVHDRAGLPVAIEVGQGTSGWKLARSRKPFTRMSWSPLGPGVRPA